MKTIDDYRQIVKILKLKAYKIQAENQTLNNHLSYNSSSHLQQRLAVLQKQRHQEIIINEMAMVKFALDCQRIGICPQMIFRIGDRERKKRISIEQFRNVMKRVKIDHKTIERVGYIVSKKTGNIDYENYLDYLQAYNIKTQINLQRNYTLYQQSLLSLSSFAASLSDHQQDDFSYSQFEDICRKKNMNDVEISSIFLNMHKGGRMNRRELQLQVERVARGNANKGYQRGQEEEDRKENTLKKDKSEKLSDNNKKQKKGDKKKGDENLLKDDNKIQNFLGQVVQRNKYLISSSYQKKLLDSNLKLRKSGIKVEKWVTAMLKIQENKVNRPIVGGQAIQGLKKCKPRPSKKQLQQIIQVFENIDGIDGKLNGSVQYPQLSCFYAIVKQENDSYKPLYYILAQIIKMQKITPYQYCSKLNLPDVLSFASFQELIKPLNLSPNLEQIFFKTQSKGKKDIPLNQIKQKLNQNIQFDQRRSQIIKMHEGFGFIGILLGGDQWDNYISNLKKGLKNQDYWPIYDYDSKNMKQGYWKSIFTSQVAALCFCHQQARMIKSKKLGGWVDKEFGSTQFDPSGINSIFVRPDDNQQVLPSEQQLRWITAKQFLMQLPQQKNKEILFIDDNAKSNQVKQGCVGDCWFISSLSLIAQNDQLIIGKWDGKSKQIDKLCSGVFPPLFRSFTQFGIYCMKFYKNRKPVYVVIDCTLPWREEAPQLLFASCKQKNVLWVPLIQKAYAKLHHTYWNLQRGQICQGLSDLTNSVPVKKKIPKTNTPQEKDQLWKQLQDYGKRRWLVGCSADGGDSGQYLQVDGEYTGVAGNHAYALIDTIQIRDNACQNYHKSHRLIRLQNPWGFGQWMLKWSQYQQKEQSKLHKNYPKIREQYERVIKQAKLQGREPPEMYQIGEGVNNDGTFLICFKDWRQLFSKLFVSKMYQKGKQIVYTVQGQWTKKSGGVPKKSQQSKIQWANNPQYKLSINRKDNKKSSVTIQLTQQDGRLYKGQKYPYTDRQICNYMFLLLMRLPKGQKQLKQFDQKAMVDNCGSIEARKSVQIEVSLQNGDYVVVPCTKMGGVVAKFQLLLMFDGKQGQVSLQGLNTGCAMKLLQYNKMKSRQQLSGYIDHIIR